jgi:iron-sulfur cluster assembly protein
MKPMITVSDEAAAWLSSKLAEGYAGVRVSVNKKGCAGGEYEFQAIKDTEITPDLDRVSDKGVTIFFPKLLLFQIIGSELVLHIDKFNTKLDFKNPNELARCGCGESIQLPPAPK